MIRQSTATRLLGLGYTSVLAGVGITQLIDGSGSLVALILVAFAAVAGVRMWRFGVVADNGGLVVRNTVRIHDWAAVVTIAEFDPAYLGLVEADERVASLPASAPTRMAPASAN